MLQLTERERLDFLDIFNYTSARLISNGIRTATNPYIVPQIGLRNLIKWGLNLVTESLQCESYGCNNQHLTDF